MLWNYPYEAVASSTTAYFEYEQEIDSKLAHVVRSKSYN